MWKRYSEKHNDQELAPRPDTGSAATEGSVLISVRDGARHPGLRMESQKVYDVASFEELTVGILFARGSWLVHLLFDIPEDESAGLQIPCSPELLERIGGTRNLGLGLFKPALPVTKPAP